MNFAPYHRESGVHCAWMSSTHAATSDPRKWGSESVTHGVRVTVTPQVLPHESDAARSRFVFGYRISIRNESDQTVTLMSREWLIVDATGERQVVKGEGVVGKQPRLPAGHAFEYSSYSALNTRWGTMEGCFLMTRDDGEPVRISVGRFYLVAPEESTHALDPTDL